jgi:transposase
MDWEAITAARNEYVGYQAILSTRIKDPLQALQIYREKDVVEKCFSDLKNQLDMKRLRVHRSPMMKGRLFIQFVAMILLSQIRNVLREQKELASYTARGLLKEMESLTTIHYSGTYKDKHSEVTKRQREILAAFNLQVE